MDKITKSLINYLKDEGIAYQLCFNCKNRVRDAVLNSTCFQMKSKFHKGYQISMIVEVYTGDDSVHFTAFPHAVYDEQQKSKMEEYAQRWRKMHVPTRLYVEEELGVDEMNKYCIELCMTAFSSADGMDKYLWQKYIQHMFKASETAWINIDKVTS